ncbi:hypothetical protein [Microvirga sp. 2TAF3]|uniref:hypothetical protein n=1 Tax=Microvirga sp. 2TAF3 TaxID=3233014 RepID=UPI003F99D65D
MTDEPFSNPASREKLTPARIAEMRGLVEGTTRSYKRIGAELGISASTVSRYATQGEWRRPPGAALPARIARQRDKVTEKLWKLTARHAKALEDQPIELIQDSLQPLASLTRALGGLSKHVPVAPAAEDHYPDEDARPPRSIHELRDELAAHLERIEREEGEGWSRFDWWFEHGGGI